MIEKDISELVPKTSCHAPHLFQVSHNKNELVIVIKARKKENKKKEQSQQCGGAPRVTKRFDFSA